MMGLTIGLTRIKELTSDILSLQDMAKVVDDKVEYYVDKGECGGVGLLKNDAIAVQIAFMTAGTELKKHAHPELEIIIVWEGDLSFKMEHGNHELGVGDYIIFQPETPHLATTITGCKMLAITVPSSKGYPQSK